MGRPRAQCCACATRSTGASSSARPARSPVCPATSRSTRSWPPTRAPATPFALLQIDIDYFKSFNDHYGYARGDDAIRAVARILVDQTRSATAARGLRRAHRRRRLRGSCTLPDRAEALARGHHHRFRLEPLPDALRRRSIGSAATSRSRNRRHVIERFPLMTPDHRAGATPTACRVTHLRASSATSRRSSRRTARAFPAACVVGERRTRGPAGFGRRAERGVTRGSRPWTRRPQTRGDRRPDARGIEQLAQAMLGAAQHRRRSAPRARSRRRARAARSTPPSYRLLRLDPRSGALRVLEASGVETPLPRRRRAGRSNG